MKRDDLVVRQLQELVEQAELVHHFERRGMDGVAAEVAQEVAVLLQHDRPSTPARASRKPSIMPAGPPPTMQHWVWIVVIGVIPNGVRDLSCDVKGPSLRSG